MYDCIKAMFLGIFSSISAAIDCMTQPDPTNGEAVFTTTTLDSVLDYSCDQGYIPSHTEDRVCLANGDWSGEAVTCTRTYKYIT